MQRVDSDAGKEFVFAVENVVKYESLSQNGCEVSDAGLVMIDSRGADGRTLKDHGKRQIWLKIGNNLRQYDFHVVEVTKPILSVSYVCENLTETHPARNPVLTYGGERDTLIKKNGVYFVKAQIVHKSRAQSSHAYEQEIHKIRCTTRRFTKFMKRGGDSQNSRKITSTSKRLTKVAKKSCVRAEDSQKSCVRAEDSQKLQKSCVRADGLQNSQKSCEREDGLQISQKSCVRSEDSQNSQSHAYEQEIHKVLCAS